MLVGESNRGGADVEGILSDGMSLKAVSVTVAMNWLAGTIVPETSPPVTLVSVIPNFGAIPTIPSNRKLSVKSKSVLSKWRS